MEVGRGKLPIVISCRRFIYLWNMAFCHGYSQLPEGRSRFIEDFPIWKLLYSHFFPRYISIYFHYPRTQRFWCEISLSEALRAVQAQRSCQVASDVFWGVHSRSFWIVYSDYSGFNDFKWSVINTIPRHIAIYLYLYIYIYTIYM